MIELNMTEPLPMWSLAYTFDLNYVIPLVGVIIGWLLNEYSQILLLRRKDRRAIGRALADLMEIRHNLFGVRKISNEIISRLDITPQDQPVFRNLLDSTLPNLESLHKRYEEDVNMIASTEPLLGFRLRSKDSLAPALRQLRSIASTDKVSSTAWSQMETQLIELVEPHFEKHILELARLHSWRTWFKVWRYIRKPLTLPPEMEELMSSITNENPPT